MVSKDIDELGSAFQESRAVNIDEGLWLSVE